MGVGRVWAVDRPCSAPRPGQHNHVPNTHIDTKGEVGKQATGVYKDRRSLRPTPDAVPP